MRKVPKRNILNHTYNFLKKLFDLKKFFRFVSVIVIVFMIISLFYSIDLWTNRNARATGYSFSDDLSASSYLDLNNSVATWDSANSQVTSLKGDGFYEQSPSVGGFENALTTEYTALSPSYNEDESSCGSNPANCTIFTVSNGYLYKSVDNGVSWTDTQMAGGWSIDYNNNKALSGVSTGVFKLSPDYDNDNTVFVMGTNLATSAVVGYKSTDGGSNWSSVTVPAYFDSIAFSPTYSEDETDCSTNPANCTIFASYSHDVYKSHDKGTTWDNTDSAIVSTPAGSTNVINIIKVSPDYINDNVIVFGTEGGGIYGSGDCSPTANTCTGSAINTGISLATPNGEGYVNDIEFSPAFATDNTIFSVSGGDAPTYRGQTLKTVNCDNPNSSVCSWSKITNNMGWAGVELSPLYDSSSYDDNDWIVYTGGHWDLQNWGSWLCTDDDADYPLDLSDECDQLTNLTTDGSMRFAGEGVVSPNSPTDLTIFIDNFGQGLQKFTYNAGTSNWDWSYMNSGISSGDLNFIQVSPNYANDSTIFACSKGKYESDYNVCNGFLYKSTDSGVNWSKITDNTTYVTAYKVSPNYTTDNTIYAGEAGIDGAGCNILKSTNGGNSWVSAGTDVACSIVGTTFNKITSIDISPVNADTLFAGTYGGKIHTSTDGGGTWDAGVALGAEVTDIAISPSFVTDGYALTTTNNKGVSSYDGAAWGASSGAGGYDFITLAPQYDNDEADCASNPEKCTAWLVDTDNNKLYFTNDKWGTTLDLTPSGGFPDTIRSFAISPNYEYGDTDQQVWIGFVDTAQIYKSLNSGTDWNLSDSDFGSAYASQMRGVNLGDINGDGLDDFANTKEIFLNVATGIDNTKDYDLNDIYASDDINDDGYADVVDKNGANINVLLGSASFDVTADYNLDDIDVTSESIADDGVIVADINGDGYKDVIAGIYSYDSDKGITQVYLGGKLFNDVLDFSINGENANDKFGYTVSAGDVNGDGFDDLAISAPGFNSSTGKVYVYYGGKGFDDIVDVVITGSAGDMFGDDFSIAGDVNGDVYNDIVVGAPATVAESGNVYIFYGSSSLSSTMTTGDADITLNDSTAENDSEFGEDVEVVDIDKNGYADVVVGAPKYKPAGENRRIKTYVYFGGATFDATVDYTYDPGNPGSDQVPDGNIKLIDIDNDGYLDARVVSHNGSDTIYVDATLIDIVSHSRSSFAETNYKSVAISPNYANDKKIFSGGYSGLEQSFTYKYGDSIILSKIVDNTIESINTATLTATDSTPSSTSISYYLSNDGGVTWESTTSGSAHTFTSTGSDLRWKAVLNTTDVSKTAYISNISITYGNTNPGTPTLTLPSNGGTGISLNPTFQFSATDTDSDKIYYILEIGEDSSLNDIVYNFDQKEDSIYYVKDDSLGWSQVNPYNSGDTASFILPSKYQLTGNATYYWRVAAVDENGGASYSNIYSFTTTGTVNDNFDTTTFYDSANTTAEWGAIDNAVRVPATNVFAVGSAALSPVATANDTKMVLPYDVDYDGDQDILVANYNSINYLYTNDGSGSFTQTTPFPDGVTSRNTNFFLAVDLDRDGDADIIEGNNGQNYYYTNDGSGSFTESSSFGSNNTTSLYAIDIDKDGDIDILEGTAAQDKLWTNNGDGTFTVSDDFFNGNTRTIVANDIDNDGDFDVLISDADNDAVKVYTNDGTATFTLSSTLNYSNHSNDDSLIINDFDSDGDQDIVVSNGIRLFLYLNDGQGIFTVEASFNYTYGSMIDTDVDLDGDIDIIALAVGSGDNALLRNYGHGEFKEETGSFASGPATFVNEVENAVPTDIDGDGDLDIIHYYSCRAGGCTVADDQNYIYENNLHNNDADDGWTSLFSTFPASTSTIISLGDVNYDGYEDLGVQTGVAANTVSYLYTGNGKNSFTQSTPFTNGSCGNNDVSKSADFNGDGYLDILVGADNGYDCVYFNDGSGNFNTITQIFTDTNSRKLWANDIDNDGDMDIIIFRNGQNYIYTNSGDGSSFTQTNLGSGINNTLNGYTEDIDNDGDVDILVANGSSTQNYLFRNDGSGNFTQEAQFGKGSTDYIYTWDLNRDGFKDIVVANSDINSAIYWNKGDDNFIKQSLNISGTHTVGDIDSDGDGDIYLAAGASGSYIYRNDSSGNFTIEHLDGILADLVSSQDINRDGQEELLISYSSGTSAIYTSNLTHTAGTYIVQSLEIDDTNRGIQEATLTADNYTPGLSTIQYYLSNDGGTTWETATSGVQHIFNSSGGNDLRWKAEIQPGSSPIIYSVSLAYTTLSSGSPSPTLPANPIACRGFAGFDSDSYAGREGNQIYWVVDYIVDGLTEEDRENLEFIPYISQDQGADVLSTAYSNNTWCGYFFSQYESSNTIKYWIPESEVNEDAYFTTEYFWFYNSENESGLKYNTKLSGRKVYVKYKNNGALSNEAAVCPDVWSLAEPPNQPTLNLATSLSLAVSIDNYSFDEAIDWGESGVKFEIYEGDEIIEDSQPLISEFVSAVNNITFNALNPGTTYTVRAQGYNGDGIATPWSEPLVVETLPPSFSLIKTATITALGQGQVQGISVISPNNFNTPPRVQYIQYLGYLGNFSAILSFFILLSLIILIYHLLLWSKAQRVSIKVKYQKKVYSTLAIAVILGIVKVAMIATMAGLSDFQIATDFTYQGDGEIVEPDDVITYRIDYINETKDDLKNVVITDSIDQVLADYDNLTKNGEIIGRVGDFIHPSEQGPEFSYELGEIKSGVSGYLTIPFEALSGSFKHAVPHTISNTAIATYIQNSEEKFVDSNTLTNPTATAAINIFAFIDKNNNGQYDQGEQGLRGVHTLAHYDINDNGILDDQTETVLNTYHALTSVGGYFTVDGQRQGKYFVEVGNNEQGSLSIPEDYSLTTPKMVTVDLERGGTTQIAFGFYKEEEQIAPIISYPVNNSEIINKQPTVNGNSYVSNGLVNIYLDGEYLATITANSAGFYSYPLEKELSLGPHTAQVSVNGIYSSLVNFSVIEEIVEEEPEEEEIIGEEEGDVKIRVEIGKINIDAIVAKVENISVREVQQGKIDIDKRLVDANFIITLHNAVIGATYEFITESDPFVYQFIPQTEHWIESVAVPLPPGNHKAYVRIFDDSLGDYRVVSNVVEFNIALPACYDDIDNDGDNYIDYPDDPGCLSIYDKDETDIIIPGVTEEFFTSFIDVTKQIVDTVGELADDPEVEKTTQNYIAPALIAVVAVNTTTAISFIYLIPYLQFLFTEPLRLLSRRKRKGWGTIYNSISKEPVDLAIVRLLNAETGALVQTQITDKQGRYNLIVKDAGIYKIEVKKPEYKYPTELLSNKKEDVTFLDLYHGEKINVDEEGAVITANIPLDPVGEVKSNKKILAVVLARQAQNIISLSGLGLSIVTFVIVPKLLMGILVALHIMLYLLFRRLAYPGKPKGWGIVYDKDTKKPLNKAIVRIFDTQFNKLLATQVTDSKGRYGFLIGPNIYYITSEKPNYSSYKSEPLDLGKEAAIALDVSLKKKGGGEELLEIAEVPEIKEREEKPTEIVPEEVKEEVVEEKPELKEEPKIESEKNMKEFEESKEEDKTEKQEEIPKEELVEEPKEKEGESASSEDKGKDIDVDTGFY